MTDPTVADIRARFASLSEQELLLKLVAALDGTSELEREWLLMWFDPEDEHLGNFQGVRPVLRACASLVMWAMTETEEVSS